MERYRIVESVARRIEQVHTYEDLEIHHPTANGKGLRTGRSTDFEEPHKRKHARIEGQFEEFRREADGRVLVKKDFILSRENQGPVHVPSPASGYVYYLGDRTQAVRIYDRPHEMPGARLLAQSLHMDPDSFRIPEGGRVQYGQPLGLMSDTGSRGSIHAHVEAEPEQFRRYIRDIDNGIIGPGHWPERERHAPVASGSHTRKAVSAPAHNIQSIHPRPEPSDLQQGDNGPRVRDLQHTLNRLGVRDAQGLPLLEDGDFGRRTREAVEAFQREHALPGVGRVGQRTREALQSAHGLRITDPRHADYALFERTLGLVQSAEGARGIASGPHSANLAAALVVQMRRDGLQHVDRIDLSEPPRFARAVQVVPGAPPETERVSAPVDTRIASSQSLHASSDQLARLPQAPVAPKQAEEHVRTQAIAPVR